MDAVFKALADASRRDLLYEIFRNDEQALHALEGRFAMIRYGVMKHLKVLKEADLVVADAVERLRAEGKTVLLHCVRAKPQTPTVPALYGAHVPGVTPREALADLRRVLPGANPNPLFLRLLKDAELICPLFGGVL